MTLAQGRVLYDVWERRGWHEKRLGYLVPSHLTSEARKISGGENSGDWRGLPAVQARRYESAWEAVVRGWPRMPGFGVGRVVERLVRLGLGNGKLAVEEAVVRYARRNWTSYWLRMGAGGFNDGGVEEQVCEAVAERLRVVLRSWMAVDVSSSYVGGVFERHGVVEKQDRSVKETLRQVRFC